MNKLKIFINDMITVNRFHASIESLRNSNTKKSKTYKVRITENQMGLLYGIASLGVNNTTEFGNYLRTIAEPKELYKKFYEDNKTNFTETIFN